MPGVKEEVPVQRRGSGHHSRPKHDSASCARWGLSSLAVLLSVLLASGLARAGHEAPPPNDGPPQRKAAAAQAEDPPRHGDLAAESLLRRLLRDHPQCDRNP